MKKICYGVLLGLFLGIVGVLLSSKIGERSKPPTASVVRNITSIDVLDAREVAEHRNNHFVNLKTIASLLSLPDDSLRSEALNALSGRSDLSASISLAEQANRITDPFWREQSLRIVFRRLASLDPERALELARSERFFASRVAQATAIQTWARHDLMGAVSAIASLDDHTQYMAAQMLYNAIGGAYTPEAELAEQELGIAPSESNRSRYVRELFAVAPEAALDHIVGLESGRHRSQQIRLLGYLFAFSDYQRAEAFGERISDASLRRGYLEVVYRQLGREQPVEAAKRQFSLNDGIELTEIETRAFQLIAREDLQSAIAIFSDPVNQGLRKELGEELAKQYAKIDPTEALQWASGFDNGMRDNLLAHVIRAVADSDPEFAMRQVTAIKESPQRGSLTLEVFGKLIRKSPADAARAIDSIGEPMTRSLAINNLVASWLSEDAFRMLDWLSTTDPSIQQTAYSKRGLMRNIELDEAQSLVGSIPVEYRQTWLIEVVDRLIDERSGDDAMSFIDQFSGQAGHDKQVAIVVARFAQKDTNLALRYLSNVPAGNKRDGALSMVVQRESRVNPAKAATLLPMLADADLRHNAAADIASSWLKSDPDAARSWLDSMPVGSDRDNILMNTVIDRSVGDAMKTELIQQISDVNKRDQAMLFQEISGQSSNPEEVIRLLEKIDMPEIFKQQLKSQLIRNSVSGR